MNGNHYDEDNTRGKILVLKCWFIHCTACVLEFPQLNKLVDDYKNDPNILFISLAIDNKDSLTKFLKTKPFKYAVVPDLGDFMEKDLGVNAYPTHIVVDNNGIIIKVTNRAEDLIAFLKKVKGED